MLFYFPRYAFAFMRKYGQPSHTTTPIALALKHHHMSHMGLSRSPNGYSILKPLLGPGGRFIFETAARRSQERNGRCASISELKRL
jgi:hypothetical protein